MLYLLKSGNYLKIGYAKNIEERMKLYNTHNPDFELLDTKEGTLLDEKELHRICKKWKYRTEWYYYNEEIIKIFKEFIPKNLDFIFKFLVILKDKEEEIIVDTCKYNQDAEKYILNKYKNNKSVYRIYNMSFSKTCIYPDKVIHDLEIEVERLREELKKK